MKNVAHNHAPRTDAPPASTRRTLVDIPLATRMRELLGWVADNVEHLVEDDVGSYESNSLRSQVMQLLALANDVEEIEVHKHLVSEEGTAPPTLRAEKLVEDLRARLDEAAIAFVRVDGAQIHASDDYADPMHRGDFSVAIARAHKGLDALQSFVSTLSVPEAGEGDHLSAAAEE